MKFKLTLATFFLLYIMSACKKTDTEEIPATSLYQQNRSPLQPKPYLELPLGAIQPKGWILDQLKRMRSGMTGHLDEIYPEVVGSRNGWLGGDGDGWERGPYWIDGLLPLAYILNDDTLKAKVQPWIEWTLDHQAENGYMGPIPFEENPAPEPGIQKGPRRDWWPKMVMLKVLQQYYNATGDERVITTLTKYFHYQLQELPQTPLDHWSFWADRRGGDNLQIVYWLYNITEEPFLLELAELIHEQTFPWTKVFLNEETYAETQSPWQYFKMKRYPFDENEIRQLTVAQKGGMHCVNFAQGLKQPIVYYQQQSDEKYIQAVKKALLDIKKYHGQPQGMYGGDEGLHGNNPVQGVEFCSIAEMMYSLETMLSITGDMEFADHLEKIAYNALPAQASDDFSSRQYFQAANQVQLTDDMKASYQTVGHQGTDFCFGVFTGYPCCTTNMHQAWPKYVQNLWYATADGGLAALLYAPSEVEALVGDSVKVRFIEETDFPFNDKVTFTIETEESVEFPFHLRIPAWTKNPEVKVNGVNLRQSVDEGVFIINRTWKDGDMVTITLPMQMKTSQWYDFATTLERGPLVYALKIEDEWKQKDRGDKFGQFYEVFPKEPWNYALYAKDLENLDQQFELIENEINGYPWNLENAPIHIKARGIALPEWQLSNSLPSFPAWWGGRGKAEENIEFEEITLVPYGCTTLRITEFPVYGLD